MNQISYTSSGYDVPFILPAIRQVSLADLT